jgi:hypothetical protein
VDYKTVGDDAVPLEDRQSALGVVVVIVINEIGIRHALFLLDVDGGLDDFTETRRVRVSCLKRLGDHDGQWAGGREGPALR